MLLHIEHDNLLVRLQVLGAVDVSEMPEDKRRALEGNLAVKLGALKNASYTSGWRSARGAMLDACKM